MNATLLLTPEIRTPDMGTPDMGTPDMGAPETRARNTNTPEGLVQAQLTAYNAHDVEALLRCYHPHAQQFEYPDRLLAQGHEALKERMAARFEASRPAATLLHRTVLGHVVIDHERILNQSPQGPAVRELVAMYEVEATPAGATGVRDGVGAGLVIVRARFIFGDERPA